MLRVLAIVLILVIPQSSVYAREISERDIVKPPIPNSCGKINEKAKLYLDRLGVITLRAEFCYQQDCELIARNMNKVERAHWFCAERVVAGDNDINGNGLECKYIRSGEIEYYIFEDGETVQYLASALVAPPKIVSYSHGLYHAAVSYISWGWPYKTTLIRKTLKIQSLTINDNGVKAICKLRAPKEIKMTLQKKVEEMNRVMKKNKL
jgi:hypothetical protein